MINNPKSTWVPLVEKFLMSWDRVDAERLPSDKIRLGENYGRQQLRDDCTQLASHLDEESRFSVQLAETKGVRDGLHTELLGVVRAFNRYYSISDKTGLRRLIVRTPSRKGGSGAMQMVCGKVESLWRNDELMNGEGAPLANRILGLTAADFLAKLNEFNDVCAKVAGLERKVIAHKIQARNLVKEVIQPRLIAYRRMVSSQYPLNHPFVLSIPELRLVNTERRRMRGG